jgi:hypothetical protein
VNRLPIQWEQSAPLAVAIRGAMDATEPFTKARQKALKAVKWRLRAPDGQYAGLDGLRAALVPAQKAQTFDGRDNERTKIAFYSAILRTPLTVELIAFAQ